MAVPGMSILSRLLPPLLLSTGLGAALLPACDKESGDRKPGNAPEAPREQEVLHDANPVDVVESDLPPADAPSRHDAQAGPVDAGAQKPK